MHRVVLLLLASIALTAARPSLWREVLYQAFQKNALSASIKVDDRFVYVPLGWESLPRPTDPTARWTIARWDGGNDRRMVDRTYLVTNSNGLPDCWLTKVLSDEVGPEFELQCVLVTLGTPAALTLRIVNDAGGGYDATVSLGVNDTKHSIRRIEPRIVRQVNGQLIRLPVRTSTLATAATRIPVPDRLRWYRPRLVFRDRQLVLYLDGRELLRAKNVEPHSFTSVQFLSPQRVFLDDFEMWGTVTDS